MEPNLSEFSYGYAVTSELMAKFGLKRAGAPVFATQNAEAKAGGGWDMKLPRVPIYLQFKRSDRMMRRSAKEATKFESLPFYRMYLRRRDVSDQHKLMLELEKEGKYVFYAAPGFADTETLSESYIHDTVCDTSIFIRPSAIGPLTDDEKHHVAFQIGGKAYFCSEPQEIETVNPAALLENLSSNLNRTGDETPDQFEREAKDLLRVYEKNQGSRGLRVAARFRELRGRRSSRDFADLIARTLFELELLVLQTKK